MIHVPLKIVCNNLALSSPPNLHIVHIYTVVYVLYIEGYVYTYIDGYLCVYIDGYVCKAHIQKISSTVIIGSAFLISVL